MNGFEAKTINMKKDFPYLNLNARIDNRFNGILNILTNNLGKKKSVFSTSLPAAASSLLTTLSISSPIYPAPIDIVVETPTIKTFK